MKKTEQAEPISTLPLFQETVKWKNQPSERTQHCCPFTRIGGMEMEKERYLKYVEICERAERMKIDTGDRMGALMDIESADKKFNMRLDDWLQADDFNFAHDYCGIQNNIKRGEFPATDFGFFLPRFAGTH